MNLLFAKIENVLVATTIVLIFMSCSKRGVEVTDLDDNDTEIETMESISWLEGSWGVTFPVFGGERLDAEVAAGVFDLVRGAQELVDELPAVGHVITN